MKSALSILGWIVAVVAVIAAGVLFFRNQALQVDLDRANDELAVMEAHSEAQRTAYTELRAEVDELKQQVAQAEQAASAAPPMEQPAEEPESAEEEAGGEPEADSAANTQGNTAQRAARAQMGVVVGMQYNSLLADLALAPETLDAVNDLLIDSQLESQQVMARDIMSGSLTAKEAKAKQDAIDTRLREHLSEVLNAEDMAQWDAYQEFADEVLYEAILDGQLAMLAPGLTEETRATAKIVLAEDLAAELDRFFETDTQYTLTNFNQAQLTGLNHGMARIPDTVSEEQYAHLTGFVDQVAATFQQMAGPGNQ